MFKKVIYFSVAAIVLIFIEKCEPYKDDANDKQAMFRGNVTHNGFYNSPSINKQPVIKWKFKTDGAITSSGTIEGENIFFWE